MYQQEAVMLQVSPHKICAAHKKTNFLRHNDKFQLVRDNAKEMEDDMRGSKLFFLSLKENYLFFLFVIGVFVIAIAEIESHSLRVVMWIALIVVVICGILGISLRNQKTNQEINKKIDQRFQGFASTATLTISHFQIGKGESLVALFERKVVDHRRTSQRPSLRVRLSCYEITETVMSLSDSEFEKETLWQSGVEEYRTKPHEDLRVQFTIDIPADNMPLSTPKENIRNQTSYWSDEQHPPKTHILWLLELYEPVTQIEWYIPIEVTTPAHEAAQVAARHAAAKAKKLEQASHGVDWDRDF